MPEITCFRLSRAALPLVAVLLGGAARAQQRPLRPGAAVAPAWDGMLRDGRQPARP